MPVLNRDLVEKMPSSHTYLLLGDAYINIQEVGIKLPYILHINLSCIFFQMGRNQIVVE